ncbi:MAG: hypothetical protein ACE5HD_12010 [Acidobacteriota bacterium]
MTVSVAILTIMLSGWIPPTHSEIHQAIYILGTAQQIGGKDAGLSQSERINAREGIHTRILRGPRPLALGSVNRRADQAVRCATVCPHGHPIDSGELEIIGYSRGAIAALEAARRLGLRGRDVGLLVTVDPEVRSRFVVPASVRMVVNITNGDGYLEAEDRHRTQVINLEAPRGTGHVGKDAIDEYVSDFVAYLVWLQEKSGVELTLQRVKRLAGRFGLSPVSGISGGLKITRSLPLAPRNASKAPEDLPGDRLGPGPDPWTPPFEGVENGQWASGRPAVRP